jgi:hypothetical protein
MIAQGRTLKLLRLTGIVGIITGIAMSIADIRLLRSHPQPGQHAAAARHSQSESPDPVRLLYGAAVEWGPRTSAGRADGVRTPCRGLKLQFSDDRPHLAAERTHLFYAWCGPALADS